MPEPTRPSTKGIGCAVLFLMPFAAFGLAMVVITAWSVVDWVRIQSWVATPATLLTLELVEDESDRIDAEYEYTFAGQKYKGTRVALHSGSDNIGRFQQRKFQQLQQAKRQGNPVTAYVNASNPREAVLLRDLRPEMMVLKGVFALVFGLIGFGGMVGVRYANRDTKREIALANSYPDEPWRWREDWGNGVISSKNASVFLIVVAFTTLWNVAVWAVAVGTFGDGDRPSNTTTAVLLLFGVAGIVFAVLAFWMFLQWRSYPRATFRMASTPGVVGGSLAGVVLLPGQVRSESGFRITLTCTENDKSDNDNEPKVLWEDERIVVRTLEEANQEQTAVPVAFVIPSDASASDPHAKCSIDWKLSIQADLPGPDLSFDFNVPVFRTSESRDDVVPAGEPLTEFERSESLAQLLAAERIAMGEGAAIDSIVYRVPPARQRGLCISITVFAVIWIGIVIGLFWFRMWLFASLFTLLAAIIVPVAIHTWLAWSELRITGDQWHYRWGWWPWTFATRQFDSKQIMSFVVNHNTRSGSTTYGDLVCNLRDGKPVTLARMLSSRRAERLWIDELRRHAGLGPGLNIIP